MASMTITYGAHRWVSFVSLLARSSRRSRRRRRRSIHRFGWSGKPQTRAMVRAIVPVHRARRRETRVRSSAARGSFSFTSRASSRGRRRTLSMTRGFERGGRDDARARSSPWTRWSGCGLRLMPESVIVRVTTDWTTAERTNERTVVARVEVRIDVGRRRNQRWGALTRRWRSRRNSP